MSRDKRTKSRIVSIWKVWRVVSDRDDETESIGSKCIDEGGIVYD